MCRPLHVAWTNKLLFKRMLAAPDKPDGFLVVVRPEVTGILRVGSADWRSPDSWLIAFSECRDQQEAMLLMPARGWIQAELGRLCWNRRPSAPGSGGLYWLVPSRGHLRALLERVNCPQPNSRLSPAGLSRAFAKRIQQPSAPVGQPPLSCSGRDSV